MRKRLSNLESLRPDEVASQSTVDEEALKHQVILETVAEPMEESFPEVENIPSEGPAYVLDLPFVGFTFTPTMLSRENKSRQKQIRSK